MQPTLQTGIFRFLYNTWAHNADALAYFMGIGITFLLLFHKPRRSLVLILIGFICLFIRFEYIKHVADPLRDQTVGAIIQGSQGLQSTQQKLGVFFDEILPLMFYIGGWGGLFSGLWLMTLEAEGKDIKFSRIVRSFRIRMGLKS